MVDHKPQAVDLYTRCQTPEVRGLTAATRECIVRRHQRYQKPQPMPMSLTTEGNL